MNLLSAEKIRLSFNEKQLLNEITLGLQKGDKISLVGYNGAGKSTLLKVLAGIQATDTGSVSVRDGIRIAYLPQQPEFNPQLNISEVLFEVKTPQAVIVAEYEAAMEDPETYADQIPDLIERMNELDAWDYESKVKELMGVLGIHNLHQKAGELSGGQTKRVALARVLLLEPDVLLMDEPTNHLDLDAIRWLENYLKGVDITFLTITHDRYFLDNISNEIIELSGGALYRYKGKYAYYLEKKAEREANRKVVADKAANLLKKEMEWMRRQPKARGTKAKYRIDAIDDLKAKASDKIIERNIDINLKTSRLGGKIMELTKVSFAYDNRPMVENFTYTFRKNDKIGVIGKNGIGKSTFLNLLNGVILPQSGELERGETLRLGYYTQDVANLNPENRVIDEVRAIAEYITLADNTQVSVSKLLEMFLFEAKQQYDYIHKLSGGEKRRLQLLKILVSQPNFLILDEPTNDLDTDTLNALEQYLEGFNGCLMIVSHDRYFMDRLAEHLFVFEGNGIISDYPGNYTDWREDLEEREAIAKQEKKAASMVVAPTPAKVESKPKSNKLSFKEQQELESLEQEISNLEAEKQALEARLSNTSDYEGINKLSADIGSINKSLDQKTLRWLELSE